MNRFVLAPLSAVVLATLTLLVSAADATPKGCAAGSPAVPAPATLWRELQPTATLVDSTAYNGNQLSSSRYVQSTSVDVENGFLFNSYWSGFQIWDARGANAAHPLPLVTIDGYASSGCNSSGVFPSWGGCGEVDNWIYTLDAPTGDDSVVALGGIQPLGLSVFDTTNKTAPRLTYQDPFRDVHQIWSTPIGSSNWAFVADLETGLYAVNLSQAKACLFPLTCTPQRATLSAQGTLYVSGVVAGGRVYVAGSTGVGYGSPRQVQLWEVTTPTTPRLVVSGYNATNNPANFANGVGLWTQGANIYLAVRKNTALDVVNVTSCLTIGCSALPVPIASFPVAAISESTNWLPVISSVSGATPFLFLGNHDLCHDVDNGAPAVHPKHEEYLLDVSVPSAPRDIVSSGVWITDQGTPVDYWSWYYSDSNRGFSFEAPLGGKFYGDYFYRAARTILDVHKHTVTVTTPPAAAFSVSPAAPYIGDTVALVDASTGSPTTFTWTMPGGTPASSTAQNPTVSYTTSGVKTVTLNACNTAGCNSTFHSFTVASAVPVLTSLGASPSATIPGQTVILAASATGRSPLTYTWTLPGGVKLVGNPASWNTTGQTTGTKTVSLAVSNTAGSASSSLFVTFNNGLAANFRAINCPLNVCLFTAGTSVAFTVDLVGFPTLFEYDWDGNGVFEQSANTPIPLHVFNTPGLFYPKLRVSTATQSTTVTANDAVAVVPATSTSYSFYTLSPCRLIDTRTNDSFSLGKLLSGTPRLYSFSGRCNIPNTAKALSLNVTVVNASSSGYLSVLPDLNTFPTTSVCNFKPSSSRANNTCSKTSSNASVVFFASINGSSSSLDLIVDVNGYFQ